MTRYGYIVHVKSEPSRTRRLSEELRNLNQRPSQGIEVIGTWLNFGAQDATVIFTAESPEYAMEFVTKNIRSLEGVISTETLEGQPLAPFTPGASTR